MLKIAGSCFVLWLALLSMPAFGQMTLVPVITTVAGTGTACAAPGNSCGDAGAAIAASLNNAQYVAVDSAGNLYIADNADNRIRKVAAATGLISTVAGNGTQCASPTATCGDGGAATSANLYYPNATVVDAAGNLYIADRGDNRVRKVSASTGHISTIAGTGTACSSPTLTCGDGGAATSAYLNAPIDLALDGAGNLYIADYNDNRVRKVSAATGYISTIAGTGATCSSPTAGCGDGAAATSAQFNLVRGIAFDTQGNGYIADMSDNRIRKISAATGYISTIAGNGTPCASPANSCGDGGAAASANLYYPTNLAVDLAGNLYFSDYLDQRVRKVSAATGTISAFAGNGTQCAIATDACGDGATAVSANLYNPAGIAVDTSGNIYISDFLDNRIRKVLANGTAVSLPTTSVAASSAVENVSLSTTASETITSITVPASQGSHFEYTLGTVTGCTVGSSNPSGTVCVLPVTFSPAFPGNRPVPLQVVTSNGNINFALTGTGRGPLAALTPGVIATAAGTGVACAAPTASPACGDAGTATAATLNSPESIFVDSLGNAWVADTIDNRIRKFSVNGTITTVAGTGTACAAPANTCGDGGLATAAGAQLNNPTGVYVDGAGNLFIADFNDNRIRKVAAGTQILTTVAGTGTACAAPANTCGDGGAATSAQLNGPVKLAMDGQGNLYIADMYDNRIRKLGASTGLLTTVAGTGTACSSPTSSCGDGASALLANLNAPRGVFVDGVNNLYIADTTDNRVREVQAFNTGSGAGIIKTVAGTGTACAGGGAACGDGAAATAAELNAPHELYVDSAGNIYIADTGDNRIRKVAPGSGYIWTVAGNGTSGYTADGGAATASELNQEKGIALDASGNLYIADTSNNRIRWVSLAQSKLTFPTSTPIGASDATDDPETAMVSNIGNADLTFSPPGSGSNPSIATYFSLGAATTCPQLTPASNPATLSSGSDCEYAVDFTPTTAGTVSGSVVLTDNSQNAAGTQQTITLSATAIAASTTTTLSTSGTPSAYGATVTVTATVAPTEGSAVPVGTVQFSVNSVATGTPVTLNASGVATFTSATLTVGTNSITAAYTSTSSNFNSSTSSVLSQVVTKAPTSGTITWPTPASIPYGTALSATQLNATSTVAGTFAYSPTAGTVLTVGVRTLTATFTPTDTTDYSTGTASVSLTVTEAAATTTLTLSASTLAHGQALTLTATVTSGAAAIHPGTVTFCNASFSLCLNQAVVGKAQLTSSGTASIKIIPSIGTHTYKAIFAGNSDFTASTSSNASATVTGTFATTTALSTSGSAGSYTFTGTVHSPAATGLAPTGAITFKDSSNANYVVASATLGSSTQTQTFNAGSSYTATVPRDVATADFNGDGVPDMAIVNQNSGSVDILLGNGDGTFAAASGSPVSVPGTALVGIAAGDFNNDGYVDLAVTDYSGNAVYILLGNGNGTFQTAVATTLADGPEEMVTGDFNNDGNLDIAIAEYSGNRVQVLFGNGTGAFPTSATFGTGSEPYSLAVADVNGDGNLDLVAGNSGASSVTVLLGNGAGSFSQPTGSPFSAGTNPASVVIGDFDGDGKPDLALPDKGSTNVAILLGNGDGTFGSPSYLTAPAGQKTITANDFNGDGILDLAVCDTGTGAVNVFSGNGNGTFQSAVAYASGSTACSAIASADLNGDGLPELVVPTQGNNKAQILLNSVQKTASASVSSVDIPGTGTHNIAAVYAGDTYNATSTSTSSALTAKPVATALGIQASPASSSHAQQVTLTATLSPYAAGNLTTNGESITFKLGGTSIGTGTLSAGVATLSTTTLPTGSDSLTASYTADTNFQSSSSSTLSFTVTKATPTLTWATPAAISYGTALGSTQLDAGSGSVVGTMTYSPISGTVLGAGSQTLSVTFTPTDTTDYNTATDSVLLTVNKATPTLTWATPAAISYGTALSSTQLNASSGGVAGAMAYTPVSGTVLGAGSQTLSVTFTPTDATDYNTATDSVTLTVNKGAPTLTVATSGSPSTYGSSVTFTATVSAGPTGSVTFYDSGVAIGTGTIGGAIATFSTTALTAGSHTITAAWAGNSNYNSITSSSITQAVNKATPTLTWTTPSPITQGTALSATQLDASSGSVAGSFVYSPAAGTVLSVGSQTLQVTFTPADTADYTTATDSVTLTVDNKTTPAISWATPSPISYGTPLSATQLDASSGAVAGTMVYSPPAGTVLVPGSQILQVTFTPTNTSSYNTVIQTVTLTVTKSLVEIDGTSSLNPSFFGDSVTATFTFSGSGVTPTGSATITDAGVTLATVSLSAGVASFTTSALTPGSHTLKATYNGDDNYQ